MMCADDEQTFMSKEITMTDKQDKGEMNNQQTVIEDLTVNQDQAAEVKGGAHVDYYLRLRGIDGDISS